MAAADVEGRGVGGGVCWARRRGEGETAGPDPAGSFVTPAN